MRKNNMKTTINQIKANIAHTKTHINLIQTSKHEYKLIEAKRNQHDNRGFRTGQPTSVIAFGQGRPQGTLLRVPPSQVPYGQVSIIFRGFHTIPVYLYIVLAVYLHIMLVRLLPCQSWNQDL